MLHTHIMPLVPRTTVRVAHLIDPENFDILLRGEEDKLNGMSKETKQESECITLYG